MGKLIYVMNVSLDGFVETPDHSLDWGTVDDELHAWFADHMRDVSASLYGRRLYEVMSAYWPTGDTDPNSTEPMRAFARFWQATPRIVKLYRQLGFHLSYLPGPRRISCTGDRTAAREVLAVK